VLIAVPLAVVGYVLAPSMLELLNAGEALEEATSYFRVRSVGLPLVYAYMVLDAAFRATGVTRPVLKATAAAVIVNLALDPVLILGLGPAPRMEVAGAAWASVAATIVGMVLLYRYTRVIGLEVRPARPGEWAVRAARVGFPSMLERVAFVLGNVAYIGVVAGCGEESLAAHTIGVRIESLAFLPMFSLATAAGTLVGQEVGRGNVDAARRVGWEVAKASLLFGGLLGLILIVASRLVPHVFTDNPRVAWLAGVYLVIAGLTEPALGVEMTVAQIIRGAGNTVVPTIVNLASLYLLRVLPATVLPGLMPSGLCVVGAWLSMAVDVSGRGLVLVLVYRRLFHRLARRLV
ncbi:MAG: MATE family efflux transporter, partial [Desulfurococcales archaeon]|nr:MATE family efflux transporter [Desulfurococcales archaeon]